MELLRNQLWVDDQKHFSGTMIILESRKSPAGAGVVHTLVVQSASLLSAAEIPRDRDPQ
ncbi:hypothetical protein [Anderseniella sp. Alg231-50]|uniref:hypothetical protein n=1 Tax=Anderseniella sp. Alg231-50 TaxID=1922226 RepID=UPI00307BD153